MMRKIWIKEKSVVDYVRDMILQNTRNGFLGPDIDVQFYKLAIYEPGGHFQTIVILFIPLIIRRLYYWK
jgi:hypothetical protein